MDEFPTILVRLSIGIHFSLDYLDILEWNGVICSNCNSNVLTMAFGVEVFIPTDVSSRTFFTQYDLCAECDTFPDVVAFQAAREITEIYSAASGFTKAG